MNAPAVAMSAQERIARMAIAYDDAVTLCAITFLVRNSEIHNYMHDDDIERTYMWPGANQHRMILYDDGYPVGLVTWAWTSDKDLREFYRAGRNWPRDIAAWGSGTNLVLVDFIAPFGHGRKLAFALRRMFAGRKWHYRRAKILRPGFRYVELKNASR